MEVLHHVPSIREPQGNINLVVFSREELTGRDPYSKLGSFDLELSDVEVVRDHKDSIVLSRDKHHREVQKEFNLAYLDSRLLVFSVLPLSQKGKKVKFENELLTVRLDLVDVDYILAVNVDHDSKEVLIFEHLIKVRRILAIFLRLVGAPLLVVHQALVKFQ